MGNNKHLLELGRGKAKWNAWRAAHPEQQPYLTKFDLKSLDLSGFNLQGADLQGATLEGASLRATDLRRADLRDCILDGADLSGADLSGADLSQSHLFGANLNGANLFQANLTNANLKGASLRASELSETILEGADFFNANVLGATLNNPIGLDWKSLLHAENLRQMHTSEPFPKDILRKLKEIHSASIPLPPSFPMGNNSESAHDTEQFWKSSMERLDLLDARVEELGESSSRMWRSFESMDRVTEKALELRISKFHESIRDEIAPLYELNDQIGASEEAIKDLKSQLPAVSVRTQAQSFEELVKDHQSNAARWLCATVALLVITSCGAFYDYYTIQKNYTELTQRNSRMTSKTPQPTSAMEPVETSSSQNFDETASSTVIGTVSPLPLIASKLLIYSLLSFSVIWCGKNFRSEKHNQAANQHRATALHTYHAILQGTQSTETKEKLLLFAADAMYRDRPTGYDSSEKDGAHVHPIINEITKVVSKSPSGSSGT